MDTAVQKNCQMLVAVLTSRKIVFMYSPHVLSVLKSIMKLKLLVSKMEQNDLMFLVNKKYFSVLHRSITMHH